LHSFLQDLRYGLRVLLKNPGFTAVAVLTLAIGIGANSAVFSVVHGVLLRPLGYPDEQRLVRIASAFPEKKFRDMAVSPADYEDLRRGTHAFANMGAYSEESMNLTGGPQPRRVMTVCATASLLPTLGIVPLLGRGFTDEESRPGDAPVALIAHHIWRQDFGGDPGVVGRAILLDGQSFLVLGVLPPEITQAWGNKTHGQFDVLRPVMDYARSTDRRDLSLNVIGRVKPGVTLEQAQTDARGVAATLHAELEGGADDWTVDLTPLRDTIVHSDVRSSLTLLLAAVGFVLLIACVNIANLLLAKNDARRREFALRAALGAGRGRLARQLITECLLLSLAGGGLGILLAAWCVDVITAWLPQNFPCAQAIAVDGRVLAFTLGLAVVTTLLCGLVPALAATRRSLFDALKASPQLLSGGHSGRWKRDILVTGQIALALALTVCAGLALRSFANLQSVNLGFDTHRVLAMKVDLPRQKYESQDAKAAFYDQSLRRIRQIPGVVSAAVINTIPLGSSSISMSVNVEGYTPAPEEHLGMNILMTSPDYFQTLGIPLLKGRDFNDLDNPNTQGAVIVNQAFCRRFWGNEDPVGKRVQFGLPGSNSPWLVVVGVVGNVRHWGAREEASAQLYSPISQRASSIMCYVIRAADDPLALAALARQAVADVDPDQPVYNLRTMDDLVYQSIGESAVYAALLGLFGVIALVLTAVGIYGVLSYSVSRRLREFGLRIALGARTADVLRLVLTRYAVLSLIGIACGGGLALLLTRLLKSQLYAISATDPLTLVFVGALIAIVGLAAAYHPARRATRANPMESLRCE
jgi:putative ABC transport system permease protein